MTGIITLPEGTEMCMPGDNVMMHVELLTPSLWKRACVSLSVRVAVPLVPASSWSTAASDGLTEKGAGILLDIFTPMREDFV